MKGPALRAFRTESVFGLYLFVLGSALFKCRKKKKDNGTYSARWKSQSSHSKLGQIFCVFASLILIHLAKCGVMDEY